MGAVESSARFTLLARVAGGAMGEIFRAEDATTGQIVALKLLRPRSAPDIEARFRREISVLADLRHPNVVTYVDHGTWLDGRPYLAMEWLEGEDLQARLRREPIGMADAVEIVRRAAAALAAVHARGIVHRDLKLDNLWLCPGKGWPVKLIDFGVVKLPEPDGFSTEAGAIIGTPQYMAPEQARGGEVSPRSDVYGLGAVLFRLVTGRVVFPTEHIIALLGQLVLEDPPRASSIRFDVPPALDQLIATAVARKPEDRFADAAELARALARIGPVPVTPPGQESSNSVVRKVPSTPTSSGTSRSSSAMQAATERRVVVMVVASLSSQPIPTSVETGLASLLREGDHREQVQGHRMLLAFGLGHSTGDELIRASRAALLLATQVPEVRVAIASGQTTRATRGISSEALERAAAQLDRAAVGAVRVDPATTPLLGGRFVLREDQAGALLLSEDAGAARAFVAERSQRRPSDAKELALLDILHSETCEERASRAAILLGGPGIGKSRLRREMTARFRRRDDPPAFLACFGDPTNSGSKISCLGRALRGVVGIQDGEPAPMQISKLKSFVADRQKAGLSAPDITEFLGELIGVHLPEESNEALHAARQSPTLMQRRIRSTVEQFARAEGALAPLVLVVDDLQWIDTVSLDLIDWLLGTTDLRLTVVAFGRALPADKNVIWPTRNVTRLDLAPLSMAASEKLILASAPSIDAARRREMVDRAAGNALFLEELIRLAAEGGGALPVSIHSLVQARLDSLKPNLRQAIRAASVFGRSFWTHGVASLIEEDPAEALEGLAAEEVIMQSDPSRLAGQVEWTFRNVLVRDVAYASIHEEDAPAFHAKAAAWLESAGEEDHALLARHVAAGGDRGRAAKLLEKAAESALATGDLESAMSLTEKGIGFANSDASRAGLLVIRAATAGWLGQYERQIEAARSAVSLAQPGSAAGADAARILGWALREQGKLEESNATLGVALATEPREGYSLSTKVMLLTEKTRALALLGHFDEARSCADEARSLTSSSRAHDVDKLRGLDAELYVAAVQGDLLTMAEACEQMISRADAVGDIPLATRGRVNLAYALNCIGMFEKARAILDRACADARSVRMAPLEGFSLHNRGMSLARLGHFDQALADQRAARNVAETIGNRSLLCGTLQYEAICLAWRGSQDDLNLALSVAKKAREVAEDQPSMRWGAAAAFAFVQCKRRAFEAAVEVASDITSSDENIDHEFEGIIWLALIEGLNALGDRDEARDALETIESRLKKRVNALSHSEHRKAFLSAIDEHKRIIEMASKASISS
ncbi:MAG: protein kinase [Polyangiaceae bacterium]